MPPDESCHKWPARALRSLHIRFHVTPAQMMAEALNFLLNCISVDNIILIIIETEYFFVNEKITKICSLFSEIVSYKHIVRLYLFIVQYGYNSWKLSSWREQWHMVVVFVKNSINRLLITILKFTKNISPVNISRRHNQRKFITIIIHTSGNRIRAFGEVIIFYVSYPNWGKIFRLIFHRCWVPWIVWANFKVWSKIKWLVLFESSRTRLVLEVL